MAGGPLFPSSTYVGGASGNLSLTFYVSGAGTTVAQSYIEGVGVIASLGSDASAILQFNLPEVIPSGVMKMRVLAWANATSGVAKLTISDGQTAAGSNIANTTLTADTQVSQTWATADIIVENKVTLATTPTANSILTCRCTFNTSGWTLAQQSVWQFSLIWE
jgi:hypothetical protein